MTWPMGAVPFAVDELLEVGRRLNQAAARGVAVEIADADMVTRTLSEYVASLPPTLQAETARKLVAALAERKQLTSTVARRPRKAAERSTVPPGALLAAPPESSPRAGPNHRP